MHDYLHSVESLHTPYSLLLVNDSSSLSQPLYNSPSPHPSPLFLTPTAPLPSCIGSLVSLAKTVDQAHAVMTFLDCVSERNYKATIALTAARGRGKSAAIGLCLAGQWEVLS